uniref:Uncharacterized protein n=1 Tax=Arundo donax TaxID=35708 RepID=A0A0A8Z4C7_ARUDO
MRLLVNNEPVIIVNCGRQIKSSCFKLNFLAFASDVGVIRTTIWLPAIRVLQERMQLSLGLLTASEGVDGVGICLVVKPVERRGLDKLEWIQAGFGHRCANTDMSRPACLMICALR